jgi:hypothetical protein
MLINFKSVIFFISVILSTNIWAYTGLKDLETTRMKALGGAGVGSLLLNEGPILNPSSLVFIGNSSLYYQKDRDELDEKSSDRARSYNEAKSESIVITDTSTPLKGGISYSYQNENSGKRKRLTGSIASNVGKRSSFGIGLRYNEENSFLMRKTYNQIVLGITHIAKEGINFGFVVVDPMQSNEEYFKYTAGIQYTLHDTIDLLLDAGSGDTQNSEKESFTKVAVQLRTFKRFFLRYGRFHDRLYNEKGSSIGFSWVGPKFSVDFAQKTFEILRNTADTIYADEQILGK